MSKQIVRVIVGAVLASLMSVVPSSSRRVVLEDGFLPPNDLKISIGSLEDKGLTHAQYDAVLDRIQEIYGPLIASRGGRLVINRLWGDPTVNASANREGDDYVINMYGGLARHAAITQDGMALVACHEVGHHIGGDPKYPNMWATNEGQADYFANLKCLRRVFAAPEAAAFTKAEGDESLAREACGKSFERPQDRALCVRSAMAGMSVTELFRTMRREDPVPHFDTPDPRVVGNMFNNHPGTQCRLDTYYQGSLCAQPFTTDVSDTDPSVGTCTRSGGFSVGLRPRCWYLPPAGESTEFENAGVMSKTPNAPSTLAVLENGWRGF
ncbi:MAG: hypothetical protein AAB268_13200 [Elusimicrobiota bacterium]